MPKKLPLHNSLKVSLIILTIGFFGCGNQPASTSFTTTTVEEKLPRVVATTSIICDLTRKVAEYTINIDCLVPPGTNPYEYQPKREDIQAIEQANLILYSGYNLEPELLKLIQETPNSASKVAVSQQAVTQPKQLQKSGQTVTNPYIWHDPKNAIRMVEIISKNLEQLEPDNATIYSSNAQQIKNELTQLDTWIKSRIDTIPTNQKTLVTTSDALSYYSNAYGISLAGIFRDINTGEKPNAATVNNLVKAIQQTQVPTIFADTTTNPQVVQSIAAEANVKMSARKLYINGLEKAGSEADTYQKMMIANTRTIVEGLGGTYLIFEPQINQ